MVDKAYKLPDPNKEPGSFLVILYKTLKKVEYDDRAWDRIYFARCMKRTKEILDIMQGSVAAAARCMTDLSAKFYSIPCDFTIETIIAHSFDWRAAQQKKTDRECVTRLVGAYREEHRGLKAPEVGAVLQILESGIKNSREYDPEPQFSPTPLFDDEKLSDEDYEEVQESLSKLKTKIMAQKASPRPT